MRSATLRAFAKINLDLRILNKRLDGFHELRTVFQTVSLSDRIDIEFEPARRTLITLDDPQSIPDNLLIRAAQAILDAAKTKASVRMRLNKRIPMGGGLGGGSSDAAAILLALPVLGQRPLKPDKLHELALSLGSDVPFFLEGGAAVGLGRGEELYPLPDLKPQPILIISTGLHVATGPAYKALDRGLTFADSPSRIKGFQAFVRALSDGPAEAVGKFSANDFEPVVFRQHPQLNHIRERLSRLGAKGVRMTGSGSAIFAVFDSAGERAAALASLKQAVKQEKKLGSLLVVPASTVSRAGYRRVWRKQLREYLEPDSNVWPPQDRFAQ
jgi:4-diphosphocytidyl-2-C-methyl-D-erythritol kinase